MKSTLPSHSSCGDGPVILTIPFPNKWALTFTDNDRFLSGYRLSAKEKGAEEKGAEEKEKKRGPPIFRPGECKYM